MVEERQGNGHHTLKFRGSRGEVSLLLARESGEEQRTEEARGAEDRDPRAEVRAAWSLWWVGSRLDSKVCSMFNSMFIAMLVIRRSNEVTV